MADITPARRRLGRGLVATAATLAMPLTASISYSVASAQQPAARPVQPAAPVAPIATIDPDASEAPAVPVPPGGVEDDVRSVEFRREGPDGSTETRQFTFHRAPDAPMPPMPPMPAMPKTDLSWGGPDDPEFERRMEEWGKQMERWGEEFGRQWEQWGEQFGQQAFAWSEQARRAAPEVVHSCDPDEPQVTADGRSRVVICQRDVERRALASARAGLRGARAAIAANRALDEEVRREILRDLDEEIERIEREGR